MSGKVIISAVSLILVVGVVIGVIAVVSVKKEEETVTSTHVKSVTTICQHTQDKKLCQYTLSKKRASDPKEYIKEAVKATTESVIKTLNMTDMLSLQDRNKAGGVKVALEDCKDMLQFAMDSLEASKLLVRNNTLQQIQDNSPDFRTWLSSVIAFQQTCMDSFDTDEEKEVRKELETDGLDQIQGLTAMTLDIVASLSNILDEFNMKLDVKPASRRLLNDIELDHEGMPTWLSAGDRKLLAKGGRPIPHVVVARDGSGQFKTISEAVASYPKGHKGRYVIYVKAGVYAEYVLVPKTATNILMYGDGPRKTIVTGRKNFVDGVKTMHTATFATVAPGFVAKAMGFENTAGAAKHQAVALRVQGDMSAFFNCAIYGYQDTLYVHAGRQFYRNCEISGTIDFIFGMSSTVIQNSRIVARKPLKKQFNTVTADGTIQKNMNTGIVIQNCEIIPERALFPARFDTKSYLGRPWKDYSRTVVMESTIGDFIQPDGWFPWDGNMYLDTLYYAEFANGGPGADVSRRIKWKGYHPTISKDEAAQFTVGNFLKAGSASRTQNWLLAGRVPHQAGFIKA